eukprot:8627258-Alexandrium_andersonii.AAC.1
MALVAQGRATAQPVPGEWVERPRPHCRQEAALLGAGAGRGFRCDARPGYRACWRRSRRQPVPTSPGA